MMEELYEWMRKVGRILDDHERIINQNAKVLKEVRDELNKIKLKETQ